MKLNKKGFIAIETIIIASLVLLAGGLSVSKFVSTGQNTTLKTTQTISDEITYINGVNTGKSCLAIEVGQKIQGYKLYYAQGGFKCNNWFWILLENGKYKDRIGYCEKVDDGYFWIAY